MHLPYSSDSLAGPDSSDSLTGSGPTAATVSQAAAILPRFISSKTLVVRYTAEGLIIIQCSGSEIHS